MSDPVVQRLRRQIAEADHAILEAINARLELVRQLRSHKEKLGIDFVDPEQEARLLAALEADNPGPLSREGLRQLWREILALTKREVN